MIEANEGGLLKGVEELLGKVMVPALRAQDNWGRLSDGGASSDQQVKYAQLLKCWPLSLVSLPVIVIINPYGRTV